MSHIRPTATGWVTGQQGEPVTIQAEPAGDGIGPDHTPPDAVPGLDPREFRRLERDHRALVKGEKVPEPGTPELHETAPDEPTKNPFAVDPREGRGDR